jgi:FtsP/CotA-like multicopper oxidase with cupredoxin domain
MFALGVAAAMLATTSSHSTRQYMVAGEPRPEQIVINDNRRPAGSMSGRTVAIHLEIRRGVWHPNRDDGPGVTVNAFAEEGQPLSVPGPLIRIPSGTIVHAFVRNTLFNTVVVYGLSARGVGTPASDDTVQVRPGAVQEVSFPTGAAGTYYYWAKSSRDTSSAQPLSRAPVDAELAGALIVDPRGTAATPNDRVFVLNLWDPSPPTGGGGVFPRPGAVFRFTINGKAWPNTERLSYTIGDTVRMRFVNPTLIVHPMHLHGFFFNVESRGDGTRDSTFDPGGSPHMVVTERLAAGRTFSLAWVPTRSGYWLLHCHDNAHVLRNPPLDGSPLPAEQDAHPMNHTLEMMGGLVMRIDVRDHGATQAAADLVPGRRLRLIARADTGGTLLEPSFGYVLQEGAASPSRRTALLPSPTIFLKRGQPVSITVVNELPEATSVHWHGIELDSYYDGVADFSGHPGRIAPAIAPRDSFVALFTPPRSGTFIYHPHADEMRQQKAGLAGAIVVLDAPESFDAAHDIVLLLTIPRRNADASTILLNGSNAPPPLDLRVGERYRLRIVDIHPSRPSMIARLMRDSLPVTWRALAKDGMDLPPDQATTRTAVQQMGNGETYDFELVPKSPGELSFTVSAAAGARLVTMPIRVH